jgi:TctA family transporter
MISTFVSYIAEKKISKNPEEFGQGAIEGVAGPEAANNADAQCKFIPMLTLGIPASGTMALMLGALIIQGITPGPQVMIKNPDLFWGLVASLYLGNVILLILNLPLVGLWAKLLEIRYQYLYPGILLFCILETRQSLPIYPA